MVSKANDDTEEESDTQEPDNKLKKNERQKRDTLMEKVDQGNKAICEAIQSLTTHIASLNQMPPPQTMRASEQPNRKYQLQPRTTNTKKHG